MNKTKVVSVGTTFVVLLAAFVGTHSLLVYMNAPKYQAAIADIDALIALNSEFKQVLPKYSEVINNDPTNTSYQDELGAMTAAYRKSVSRLSENTMLQHQSPAALIKYRSTSAKIAAYPQVIEDSLTSMVMYLEWNRICYVGIDLTADTMIEEVTGMMASCESLLGKASALPYARTDAIYQASLQYSREELQVNNSLLKAINGGESSVVQEELAAEVVSRRNKTTEFMNENGSFKDDVTGKYGSTQELTAIKAELQKSMNRYLWRHT